MPLDCIKDINVVIASKNYIESYEKIKNLLDYLYDINSKGYINQTDLSSYMHLNECIDKVALNFEREELFTDITKGCINKELTKVSKRIPGKHISIKNAVELYK